MVSLADDFWRHVGRRTTEGVYRIWWFGCIITMLTDETEPKIDEFELLVAVKQNVLGFDVSVHDVSGVQVIDGCEHSSEEFLRLLLA